MLIRLLLMGALILAVIPAGMAASVESNLEAKAPPVP